MNRLIWISVMTICVASGCRSLPKTPSEQSNNQFLRLPRAGTSVEPEVLSPTSTSAGCNHDVTTVAFQPATPLPEPERPAVPASSVAAPSVAVDSLQELEELALDHNPALARAYAAVDVRHGRWIQAGLPPNPTVGYIAEDIGDDDTLGSQGAFVQQQFVRGGKLGWAQAAAGAAINQAHAEVVVMKQRVLTDVRMGYVDFLIASRRLQVAQRLVEISTRVVEDTDELFRRGEVRRADVYRAEAEAGKVVVLAKNTATLRDTAWRRLALTIGLPELGRPVMAEDDIQQRLEEAVKHLIGREQTFEAIVAASPQLASLRAGVDQARSQLVRAQVQAVPNVNVQLSMQYDHVADGAIGAIQIGMPIPYRNWNQGGIQSAAANVTVASRAVEAQELELKRKFETVYLQYVNARDQVSQFKQPIEGILAKTEEVLRLTTLGYQQEEFNSIEMFTAQRLYHQANLEYLDAVRQLWLATIEIDGLLLKGSLQAQ